MVFIKASRKACKERDWSRGVKTSKFIKGPKKMRLHWRRHHLPCICHYVLRWRAHSQQLQLNSSYFRDSATAVLATIVTEICTCYKRKMIFEVM